MNILVPSIYETSEFLKGSFCEVFSTVFELFVEPTEINDIRRRGSALVAGSVGFTGDIDGMVYIYFQESFARFLTGRMLRLSDAEIEGEELVNDVVGEITNMVVGATKSLLCDSGANCRLTIPAIVRGNNLKANAPGASEARLVCMSCDGEIVLLELIMKS